MKNTPVTLVAIATLMFISCTWKGSLKITEQLGWGGRAVAIDVDPTDANKVWVATPTGGLFSTAVGGTAWGHYDELGEYNCFAVKVDPESGQFIIASCIEDTKVVNGGGIWVSHDGGHTWTQPATAVPKDAQNRPLRSSAFGIALFRMRNIP